MTLRVEPNGGHLSAWLDVLASDGPPQGSDGHELPTCAVVTRSSPPPPPELVGLGPVCLRSICSRSVAFCCSLTEGGVGRSGCGRAGSDVVATS